MRHIQRHGPATDRPARGRRGVTLVELLIALTLLSIMAAVAAPVVRQGTHQVEAAMQSLGSTLLAAQRLAVTRQHDVAVVFDVGAGTVLVHEDADNDGDPDPGEHTTARDLGEGVVYGRAGAPPHPVGGGPVTFTARRAGDPVVVFHRSGSASEAGGIYLASARARSRDSSAGVRLLVLDRATGRPSWHRYAGGTDGWERGF